eukprot:348586_1
MEGLPRCGIIIIPNLSIDITLMNKIFHTYHLLNYIMQKLNCLKYVDLNWINISNQSIYWFNTKTYGQWTCANNKLALYYKIPQRLTRYLNMQNNNEVSYSF